MAFNFGEVVELVDTTDLKSVDYSKSCGFESRLRYQMKKNGIFPEKKNRIRVDET